jgi:hypothetical protein
MLLFFLPPVIQVAIGVVVLVIGLAVHMYIVAGIGVIGLAVGTARYVRSRRPNGLGR